jgi:hypothetical protein
MTALLAGLDRAGVIMHQADAHAHRLGPMTPRADRGVAQPDRAI